MSQFEVESWRPELKKRIDGLKLEVSRVNKFLERESLDNSSAKPGILPTKESASGRPPAGFGVDGPDGHCVDKHHRDREYGTVYTYPHIPVNAIQGVIIELTEGTVVQLCAAETEQPLVDKEPLPSIGRDCGEEDLPEGAMSVSLFKHQGLGKTIVMIALILKETNQQSKFMHADSGGAAIVVGKMEKSVKKQGATTMLSEVFHQEAAPGTTDVKLFVEDRNPSPPSIVTSWDKPTGGTLVVCPNSILTQWDEEIRRVAKNFGLSVSVYHGQSRIVDPEELAKHDVVLTSYGMVKQQFDYRNKGSAKKPSGTDDLNTGPIARVKWSRIVLDEAHAYDATPKLRRSEGMDSMKILSLLKDLQQACNHPCLVKKRDHQQCCTILERSYVSSKIKTTMDTLNSVINKNAIIESGRTTESGSSESAPEKVLVFSQFTRMLDMLEPILNSSHIQFRRLDEDQAIGRGHRIGQTRPVTVYHLAVQGTIEERVLYLQDKKRRMVERAFGGDMLGERATDKLTEEDLRYLFNV
ncbi:hypothetical protein PR202_gb14288 [Eleusine coracana subsp. coracana]|uniref:Helicase ATP-binding domain-containing protein n=1 Tax=Eleusine coracana subsp. coracana TaxID=191504 RepID=A0AAV5EVC3_ELECO|nr:hypothetical protein PR202_gb14288 [Eleusine coracana subsp. coracana]